MRIFVPLLVLAACNGTTGTTKSTSTSDSGSPDTQTTPEADDWCQVQAIFNGQCVICHSPSNTQGDLDLQTDPHAAIVGVTSPDFGVVLVAPGDPEGSLLYRKMAGTQAGTEGDIMPPTGMLSAESIAVVETWIANGADDVCGNPTTDTNPTGAYHPQGWEDPGVHGLGAKLQTEDDCRSCHGADLSGGSAGVACSSCHVAGWETDCTYCHGGVDNNTGAPPEDIDDNANPNTISFPEHTVHVERTIHTAFDCDTCHNVPTSALSPGHLFDDVTAGVAEVDLSGGLSSAGSWSGGSCTNLYCHGNGRTNGSVTVGDSLNCEGCHTINGLGGRHDDHIREGIDCEECHPDVNQVTVTDPDLHVNGTVEVEPGGTVTWNGTTCSGSCHFENHNNRTW